MGCFRLSKRKSIQENRSDSKDSLYPMRKEMNAKTPPVLTESNSQIARNDVFVFGSDRNENCGFRFRMGNFFRGIMNMFRFK